MRAGAMDDPLFDPLFAVEESNTVERTGLDTFVVSPRPRKKASSKWTNRADTSGGWRIQSSSGVWTRSSCPRAASDMLAGFIVAVAHAASASALGISLERRGVQPCERVMQGGTGDSGLTGMFVES
jgi:hypothetical protein